MDCKAQIRSFVIENFLFSKSDDGLHDNQSFLESGIIDSTGILELVSFIEDTFHIEILDEELIPENLDSIEKVTQFVQNKLKTTPMEGAHAC